MSQYETILADLRAAEAMADEELASLRCGWEDVEEDIDEIKNEFDSVWEDRN